jgi:hypothetical protein
MGAKVGQNWRTYSLKRGVFGLALIPGRKHVRSVVAVGLKSLKNLLHAAFGPHKMHAFCRDRLCCFAFWASQSTLAVLQCAGIVRRKREDERILEAQD